MLRLTTNLLTLVHGSAFIATVLSKLNRLTYTYTRGGGAKVVNSVSPATLPRNEEHFSGYYDGSPQRVTSLCLDSLTWIHRSSDSFPTTIAQSKS